MCAHKAEKINKKFAQSSHCEQLLIEAVRYQFQECLLKATRGTFFYGILLMLQG